MEKVHKYYEIAASEDSCKVRIDAVSQNTATKLRALT